MKINHRNLDVIGSIAPNMGKKRRNSGLYLDDPDVDIAYYVLENRGASGSQINKQKNYNMPTGAAFGIQPNICDRAFSANIVNLLRPLIIFVEDLHRGCLTGL